MRLRFAAISLLACACAGRESAPGDGITADGLAQHIQVLASDSFGGRAPASPGEEKTVNYLRQQFTSLGLQPGNGKSFFQDVPLVEIAGKPGTLMIRGRRGTSGSRHVYKEQFVAWTKRVVDQAAIDNSPLVFVGYGIVAPEYRWNDYAGLDVRGKTVVILVNDPGFATQDTTLFHGRTMTYYGRWTYKFEEAARQGAAGALIVHETAAAGYPWEVVRNSWSVPQFTLAAADNNMTRVPVEGWVTTTTARSIFKQAGGPNYDTLKARAARRGFTAVPLDLRASVAVRNTIRRSTSRNVLALLPGSARKNEYLVYTAHWDHFGIDSAAKGDQILNGARDNASGLGALLVLAQAFKAMPQPPERSVLFLAVTAEEQGLLGSQYYATYPVYPLNRTAAVINIDGLNIWGRTRDITLVGLGNSELDDYAVAAAQKQGRYVRPDPEPEKGFFYRSDHFSFAKQGVPALDPDDGIDNLQHGEQWGREQREKWTSEKYHKPSDQYDASWDLSGAVEDLKLLFAVGAKLAGEATWPNWRPGNEFRAKRDSMMR